MHPGASRWNLWTKDLAMGNPHGDGGGRLAGSTPGEGRRRTVHATGAESVGGAEGISQKPQEEPGTLWGIDTSVTKRRRTRRNRQSPAGMAEAGALGYWKKKENAQIHQARKEAADRAKEAKRQQKDEEHRERHADQGG